MEAPRRNVELKAIDPQPARTLELALGLGASDQGLLLQRDTYFAAGRGRLKLREEEPGGAHLIAYVRPDDDPAVRVSEYRIVRVPEPVRTRDALEAVLGVRVVVQKRRRLLLWEAVRIHLDEVDGLGSYLELEAVAPPDSDLTPERARVDRLREALSIEDDRLLEGSYSDALGGRG
ncbi:MAG: class IV adenylate cyclase [Solirubrobacterales bacterium]|nr:class IV adenylate cyclase [Solirubrobacterales bacterium]